MVSTDVSGGSSSGSSSSGVRGSSGNEGSGGEGSGASTTACAARRGGEPKYLVKLPELSESGATMSPCYARCPLRALRNANKIAFVELLASALLTRARHLPPPSSLSTQTKRNWSMLSSSQPPPAMSLHADLFSTGGHCPTWAPELPYLSLVCKISRDLANEAWMKPQLTRRGGAPDSLRTQRRRRCRGRRCSLLGADVAAHKST